MKSKDLQKLVLSKYECGASTTKIFYDLCGTISRKTIYNWCKTIRETGSIEMTTSPGCLRTIRTKNMMQKLNTHLKRKKSVIPITGSGTRYFENKRSRYIED